MALYLNAHHLNTRFKVMICALAIASVTRRTCVLSILLAFTIIRITQGIRSGGMQIEIFVKLWQITTAARSLIDLYSKRVSAVSAICLYFFQNPGSAVIRCFATLAAGKGRSISCHMESSPDIETQVVLATGRVCFWTKSTFFRALIRSHPGNKKLLPGGGSFLSIKGKA